MDGRRNSASYSNRVSEVPAQLIPGNNAKRASYRRPPEPQPMYAQNESPVIPPGSSSNSARQNAVAPTAPASNGVSRSSSHRRRQSQQYADPMPMPPAAPDVPRGPPTSYKDPYASRVPSSRSQGVSRSSSTRNRDQAPPTIQVNPSRQQPDVYVPPNKLSDSLTPISPTDPDLAGISRRDSGARRPSVPDRSPLQKLEGKLDDISKEERRARILEVELAAQEKAEAERAARRAREASRQQQRVVSGPDRSMGAPTRAMSSKRHVSMPTQQASQSQGFDDPVVDLTPPWDPTQPSSAQQNQNPPSKDHRYDSGVVTSGSQRQKPRTSYFDGAKDLIPGHHDKEPEGVSRGGSFRDRAGTRGQQLKEAESKHQRRESSVSGAAVPTGLGLYGMSEHSYGRSPQTGGTVGRHDSRKLQKALPPTPKGSGNGQDNRRDSRDSRGIIAAQRQMEQERMGETQGVRAANRHQEPDPVPTHAVLNQNGVPKYEIPPQTTAGQVAREKVGFGVNEPVGHEPHDAHHHHLPDTFHRHHEPDRRYEEPPSLGEWKDSRIAFLMADDLDLDTPQRRSSDAKAAWWEQSASERKRRSSTYQEASYDGYNDETTGPTSFNPPLYLKCGPLLRYAGMRRERERTGRDREIWRGSIMIVTIDAESSYQKPPSLRIFKQPMDLLPPPPAELDAESGQQLDPAYVDPLAGQVKVSRSGKTLFVKPIELLTEEADLSRIEDDAGLFEERSSVPHTNGTGHASAKSSRVKKKDGEKLGKVREVPGTRLHAEKGVTFWRFNLEIELGSHQTRVAYRINSGPAVGFWVPARGETMNMMFHSCNGFSLSVEPNGFCGPDPMWRDVLNNHQTRPFHVMIGGGDQIYNDAAMRDTTLFRSWTESKNAVHKHSAPFSADMQDELERFYLDRYSMWFSQGLFGMANSQIPMVNIWDDHDIIDGYGSYPHHFMSTPVFTGIGAVAFKYYMLFQHQSVPAETETTEPSWVLGASPGPYINQLSRSIFMFLGRHVAFLGLDCRTERQRDEILSEDTYDLIFSRCEKEIIKGETKHLIVLLGVPIAYPRLNFLENILTSRLMDPIKALGRTGMLGGFVNKFDGGVEILDDLDDHWTAKHHKEERNWFIHELQHLAAEKSVRITILGGDVHLAAVGQFFSNKKLGIPKDRDHRYMPNIVSSAIVNTPPPEMMADILNKRNKIHHLDDNTDENMIPLFSHDVDGKKRNNTHLLPRRNWCSLREYRPGTTPPASRSPSPSANRNGPGLTRRLSDSAPGKLVRRLSRSEKGPPMSYYNSNPAYASVEETGGKRRNSFSRFMGRRASADSIPPPGSAQSAPGPDHRNSFSATNRNSMSIDPADPSNPPRPNPFHRRPTFNLAQKSRNDPGFVNLQGGLDIILNLEVSQKDPAGITTPYRLLVPALEYDIPTTSDGVGTKERRKSRIGSLFGGVFGAGARKKRTVGDDGYSHSDSDVDEVGDSETELGEEDDAYQVPPRAMPARAPAPAVAPAPTAMPPANSKAAKLLGTGAAAAVAPTTKGKEKRVTYANDGVDTYPALSAPSSANTYARAKPISADTNAPLTSGVHSAPQPPSHQHHRSSPHHQPHAQEPPQQVHRRSMGGILNQHQDSKFERDAHVLAHTPSNRASGGAGHSGRYNGKEYVDDRYDEDDGYGSEGSYSQDSFEPPKRKPKWMIWR